MKLVAVPLPTEREIAHRAVRVLNHPEAGLMLLVDQHEPLGVFYRVNLTEVKAEPGLDGHTPLYRDETLVDVVPVTDRPGVVALAVGMRMRR